jgi:hypothetical protein
MHQDDVLNLMVIILECPAFFVPVVMIETGLKRSGDGTREEAHT